ncbi:nucleotide-binding universal stress UspA family protein [Paraburkholderia tropica]|uniref:universal stress protein n=1 Tax=Paraburkholderia tropica TaxID=92647 RepID=UPI001615CFC0|nr:universal stress protein [Paraburkholderia tropica]MBB3004553.1 nucleotide-binding universal stress UspA family protein [Paraburkholderia tropica]MBB6323666.1 nucleotide-binding universal stress UspA family protein [Paraburkholderia tropica]
MCYKTLLVHLDDLPRCEARQAYALDLAERFDAHLIGLYLPMPHARAPAARNGSVPEHRREHTHAQFLEAGARAGRMVEWRALQPGDTPSATLHARHADLLVLGQGEHGNAAFDPTSGLVVDLLMTAARPAVVIPHAGSFPTLARNVLIAWDGSREAARAASDALPLLRRADCVSIEMIAARPGTARVRAATEAEDAAAWLDLHDVGASFHECAREPGVKTAATLLDRASALHADMIVAGAYAHLRNFERVLGGVTHNLLETMTIPLLMSH